MFAGIGAVRLLSGPFLKEIFQKSGITGRGKLAGVLLSPFCSAGCGTWHVLACGYKEL